MKAKSPTIGKAGRKAVPIDVPKLVGGRLLITANSGGGKSWAIRRLLEQTHGHVQQIVIDPEGEFSSLREKHDFLLAAADGAGDVVVDVRSAALLARRIMELQVSAVVDIYDLPDFRRVSFVKAFVGSLMSAPKKLYGARLVVVDEAHMFCPEQGSAESLQAVKDLMSRGRKRGLCGVLATQRISELHKTAAAQANNKLCGRAALDLDVKRVMRDFGFSGREREQALKTLDPGDFYAFGPAFGIKVPEQVRVGEVETTHPEAGQVVGDLKPPPPKAAVKKILAELADLPKEAEQEIKNLEDAKKEIRTLKAELTRAKKQAPGPSIADETIMAKQKEAIDELTAELDWMKEHIMGAKSQHVALLNVSEAVGFSLDKLVARMAEARDRLKVAPLAPPKNPPTARPSVRPMTHRASNPEAKCDTDLRPAHAAILNAVAWWGSAGVSEPSRLQVAAVCGKSHSSGGFRNDLGSLRSAGLLRYPTKGHIALTEKGEAVAETPEQPLESAELQERAFSILRPAHREIMEKLVECYPAALTREDLAEFVGKSPTSGGFRNDLGSLRSLGFARYPQQGDVAATSMLFVNA